MSAVLWGVPVCRRGVSRRAGKIGLESVSWKPIGAEAAVSYDDIARRRALCWWAVPWVSAGGFIGARQGSLESIGVEEHHHESARKSRAGLRNHQLNRDDETDAPSAIPKVRARAAVCCAASFLDSFVLFGLRKYTRKSLHPIYRRTVLSVVSPTNPRLPLEADRGASQQSPPPALALHGNALFRREREITPTVSRYLRRCLEVASYRHS